MSDEKATAIAALIDTYHDRFSAGDIERVLDLWHDGGSVFEPGNPTATGKSQLRAAYERGYAGADFHSSARSTTSWLTTTSDRFSRRPAGG
jgi:ketosteroid isomerase-like protein